MIAGHRLRHLVGENIHRPAMTFRTSVNSQAYRYFHRKYSEYLHTSVPAVRTFTVLRSWIKLHFLRVRNSTRAFFPIFVEQTPLLSPLVNALQNTSALT